MLVTNITQQRSLESRCKLQRSLVLHNFNIIKPRKLLISHIILYIALAWLTHRLNTNYCLQTSTNSPSKSTTNVAIITTEKPTSLLNATALNVTNETSTSSEFLLLSGEDFVDSREVPSILFDGTTNNEDQPPTTTIATITLQPNSEKKQDNINPSTYVSIDKTNSSQIWSPTSGSNNSSQTSVDISNKTQSTAPLTSAISEVPVISTTAQPRISSNENEDDTNSESEEADDQESASNGGVNERPFEPPQNISQYMDYIEKLFHDLRHQITDLFEPHLPQLIRTSQMVDLSSSCSYDMLRMALALRQFEPWALKMIDSSGKVPEGIFEGTFTALGSYDECLNTIFEPSHNPTQASSNEPATSGDMNNSNQKHDVATQGQYCLVTVSPFMPPKPPADKVDRLFQEEANRRNYTRDDQFSRLSPMFYYMKFRIGVCIPSSCHQQDMSSIAGALSSSLRLNISIPDCRSRRLEGEPLTRHQLAGGLVFGLVCSLVLAATLLDCFKLKWKQIRSQERKLFAASVVGQSLRSSTQMGSQFVVASHPGGHNQQEPSGFSIRMSSTSNDGRSAQNHKRISETFSARLRKHWSWMSFSFLANFRLYFRPTPRNELAGNGEKKLHNNRADSQMISCLNGIRVLSLFWVIVANSYLTLDPRATKRLTKTREAPRDFLFQIIVQASLAIETFFFLSGLLMSLSFARQLRPASPSPDDKLDKDVKLTNKMTSAGQSLHLLKWVRFYVHRYVRMTPPTMLVIAFSMYAYHYGDGPLWFEATQRVHESCAQNWWRHLLHVANFIDTRQMCFIHYWYIAADMQLFLFAPLLLLILNKSRTLGYLLCALIGSISIGSVFYTTYARNLPPTLLFYSTDPESRREFGNTIMTKPFAHALPYLVGMLVGWCFITTSCGGGRGREECDEFKDQQKQQHVDSQQREVSNPAHRPSAWQASKFSSSLTGLFGTLALVIALVELFLPYKWNNSHLPSRLCSALYAALFRFGWSLVLAFIVISCRHKRTRLCSTPSVGGANAMGQHWCFCGSGGNHLNRLLGVGVFTHLSKLSFVAYLVHLPLMSVFIGQTRGLFAFSHTLVLHFAISYLVMSFALSFVLVHVIEFPFVTFERLLFDKLHSYLSPMDHNQQALGLANKKKDENHHHVANRQKQAAMFVRLQMDHKQHACVDQLQTHSTTTGAASNGRSSGHNLKTYKL